MMADARKHRILLVNFSPADKHRVSSAGYNVDLGFLGMNKSVALGLDIPPKLVYYAPYPFYDYDIYVYNSELPAGDPTTAYEWLKDLSDDLPALETLRNFDCPPYVRIAFVGKSALPESLNVGGAPCVLLTPTEENVSELRIPQNAVFSIPQIEECLGRLRGSVLRPIYRYLRVNTRIWGWPLEHFSALANRNGNCISLYGVNAGGGNQLLYLVVPQFKSNAEALLSILATLRTLRPNIFQGYKGREWLTEPEFMFPEEMVIDELIKTKVEETRAFIAEKQKERQTVAQKYDFLRRMLIATETDATPNLRLSHCVRRTFEFLGFDVTDIDEKVKSAIKKEDFWIRDGDFFAIAEVTGTANKNPKTKEYNDLLGRMTVIFKRSDLIPDTTREKLTGLLIVNFDSDTPPFARPGLYTGDQSEIVEAAKETNIGLVSTVELFKIAAAVLRDQLTKEEARGIVKQFGRIDFVEKPRRNGEREKKSP